MITHLQLEWLGDGALPIYDTADGFAGHPFFWLDARHPAVWNEAQVPRSHRVVVPLEVDTLVGDFKRDLKSWLDMLEGLGDGTLFFPIRTVTGPILEGGGAIMLVGLGFLPHPPDVELYYDIGARLDGMSLEELADVLIQVAEGRIEHRLAVEARQLQDARYQQYREQQAVSLKRFEEATARSLRLLKSFLSTSQRAELERWEGITVRGADGQEYFIDAQPHQNIYLIERGLRRRRFCVVMQDSRIPLYDMMLAQKLLLETDIPRFTALANKWDEINNEWIYRIEALDPAANPEWFPQRGEHLEQYMEELLNARDVEPVNVEPVRFILHAPGIAV